MFEITNNWVPLSDYQLPGKFWEHGGRVVNGGGEEAKGKGVGNKTNVSYWCYGISKEQDSLYETFWGGAPGVGGFPSNGFRDRTGQTYLIQMFSPLLEKCDYHTPEEMSKA